MKRLTQKKQPAGYDLVDMQGRTCDLDYRYPEVRDCSNCVLYDAIQKLAHYEDLEEQGLLPRFHLGDEFWTTMIDRVVKAKVVMLQQKKDGSWIYRLSCEITKDYHDTINYEERKYGKCFFDTKEEAEAKLQESQNGVTQSNDGVKELKNELNEMEGES